MSQLPSLRPACLPPVEDRPRGDWSRSPHHYLNCGLNDVSVCIVNWNCREVLRACLESLLRRPQGVSLEVIVVDNGSADGAPDLVEREFPEVVLVRNSTNQGFAQANNKAARLARGRYLFFLNNDTLVPPRALRGLVDYADLHPEAGIIGPRLRNGEGDLQFSYRRRPTVTTLLHRTMLFRWTGMFRHAYRRGRRQDAELNVPRSVEIVMGAAMLVPREVFFQIGAWDEAYIFGGEDMDLCVRIGQFHSVIYLPSVEVIHYGRVSTRQHLRYTTEHIPAGFVRFLRKNGSPPLAILLYKLVISLDAPLQWLAKGMQFLLRRVLGRTEKAEKSRLAMRTAEHFLCRGLVPFWRA